VWCQSRRGVRVVAVLMKPANEDVLVSRPVSKAVGNVKNKWSGAAGVMLRIGGWPYRAAVGEMSARACTQPTHRHMPGENVGMIQARRSWGEADAQTLHKHNPTEATTTVTAGRTTQMGHRVGLHRPVYLNGER
jgi:hypothetical protein